MFGCGTADHHVYAQYYDEVDVPYVVRMRIAER
jgi:hypothetical protein